MLRERAIIDAETFNDQLKFAKSKGFYKYLYSIDPNDAGAWLLTGIVQEKLKARKESEVAFANAKKIMEDGCSGLTDVQMEYLRTGLIYMADVYDMEGRGSEAKDWLEMGMEFFSDNKEYKVTFNGL